MRERQPPDRKEQHHAQGDGHGQFHPDVRIEESDLHFWGIVGTLTAFAALFVMAGLVCWWILLDVMGPDAKPVPGQNTYNMPHEPLPDEPRLEPFNDLAQDELSVNVFRRQLAMERELHSYGRASEDGFVQIPIEVAMAVAAKTLSVRTRPPQGDFKSYGLLGGGEPNSGRVYLGAPTWFEPAQ